MRRRLDTLFAENAAAPGAPTWRVASERTAVAEVPVRSDRFVGIVRLAEDITRGQAVARYSVEGYLDGAWRSLSSGTTIGYCKLDRFPPLRISRFRVTIEDAVQRPAPLHIMLYSGPSVSR
jgi:alpha-L-fucosidase